jgi:hypothetical protein
MIIPIAPSQASLLLIDFHRPDLAQLVQNAGILASGCEETALSRHTPESTRETPSHVSIGSDSDR